MTSTQNWRPHFDADSLATANVEPSIQIGSYVYVGRLLSAPQWFQWNERLQELKQRILSNAATARDLLTFYHSFFRAVFPPGWFRPGLPFWAPDVADRLLQEPLPVIEEAFERFFERQARANGAVPRTSPSTNGTSSSESIPVAAGSPA